MKLYALASLLLVPITAAAQHEADVVIYGGTSAGVSAAIQTARMGKTAILIEPSNHIGGLTTSGLGWTDSGNKSVIGGIAREFYQRVKKHYDRPEAWTYQKQTEYKFYRPADDAMWTFEPSVAEKILRDWLAEYKIPVVYKERLDRTPGKGATMNGQTIQSITMESGKTFKGKMFLDATYEGDLMAVAGVKYTIGREANEQYKETLNGIQRAKNTHNHRFLKRVDPYVKPGDPASGLLFGIEAGPHPADGSADERLQAYCFRMCMSNVEANRVPFPKPADYDEAKYELLFRNFEAGDLRLPLKPDMMPNGKTDTNNNGAVSTDFIGQNHKYPEASYAEREKIIAAHESYQKGLMWSLANHPRVPTEIRTRMSAWGLAKDEFTDNGNWPHQIYVREARRLVSDYVITENDCRRLRDTPESVGMGSYNMDSHNCMRYVGADGGVQNEGDVQVSPGGAYRISYRSIIPAKGQATNLLIPVCVSSSHIAYGSIRMEPVFFILGQSAATAAVLAIDDGKSVQEVPYDKLRTRLLADKQVLEAVAKKAVGSLDPKTLPGTVIDDEDAERKGFTIVSASLGPYVGVGYRHDGNIDKGNAVAKYTFKPQKDGLYEVRLFYTPSGNRATNVPVTVSTAGKTTVVHVNQRLTPPIDQAAIRLGTFHFSQAEPGTVIVGNARTDGYVVIDAIQFLPVP